MMPSLECRIAKIEERQEAQQSMIQDSIQERRRQSDQVFDMLHDIQDKISKMQGFTAGVAAVFGMIGASASFLWDRLVNH